MLRVWTLNTALLASRMVLCSAVWMPRQVSKVVGIVPATCKRGHPLATVVVRDEEVHASCAACPASDMDCRWRLTISGRCPDLAKLNDEPYRHLAAR